MLQGLNLRDPSAPPLRGTRHQKLRGAAPRLIRDERDNGVKNDRLEASALCQRVDRDERGNQNASSTVRIPTVNEERDSGTASDACGDGVAVDPLAPRGQAVLLQTEMEKRLR
jgi:hypothetical protein